MKYPNLELLEYITENTASELFENEFEKPTRRNFTMYVFPQTWSSTALGFDVNGGCGGQAITTAYTTVVEMELHNTNKRTYDIIYTVFFDGRIAYMCLNPNAIFLIDLKNMDMESQKKARKYENGNTKYIQSRISIL